MRMYGAAIAYTLGGKFRASILKNRWLILFILANFAFLTFLTLSPSTMVTKWFHMPNENFNRKYTDRITWIRYQTGLVRDGTRLPSHEPSVEGISWSTLFLIYIIMIASNVLSILVEAKKP